MIREAIKKVVSKGDLSYSEAYEVMNEIMSGKTSAVQNAAYLSALSTKAARAETIEEIQGSAEAMREHAIKLNRAGIDEVLDIVGTGGDGSGSINVSTTAAFIIAAAGIKVAKHGNRAASSKSGAADCLEALGVKIEQEPDKCVKLLQTVGMCFMFAPLYHLSMKYVGAIRRELGIRTVFNILGPLTNPAKPERMVLGVYDEHLLEPLAQVLSGLGVKSGLVVYGQNKMDELSISAKTSVCEFKDGWYKKYEISPEDFGILRGSSEDIKGGDAQENAQITREILSGQEGAKAELVILNAGAGIYTGGKAESIKDGVKMARDLIKTGAALKKLDEFIKITNE